MGGVEGKQWGVRDSFGGNFLKKLYQKVRMKHEQLKVICLIIFFKENEGRGKSFKFSINIG